MIIKNLIKLSMVKIFIIKFLIFIKFKSKNHIYIQQDLARLLNYLFEMETLFLIKPVTMARPNIPIIAKPI